MNMIDVIAKYNDESTEQSIANAPIGSKMAVRLGRKLPMRLSPVATRPVNSCTMIVTDRGIVAAYNMLRTLLVADSSMPIKSVELLWINSDKDLFLLNREVEALEREHRTRLRVTRVVDEKLLDSSASLNERVHSILSPYRLGRLGIIFSPESALSKFSSFLVSIGFAVDKDIVSIPSP